MWNTKMCLGAMPDFGIPIEEQIKLFQNVGFEGFFTGYSSCEDISKYRKAADETGMMYQSIHAPHSTVDTMWQKGDVANDTIKVLTECIHACADNYVPIMVTHAFIGFYEENIPTPEGFANFEKVVLEAEKCGVKVAFENTEGGEYTEALIEYFRNNDAVGFCWDTGHEMCYNRSKDMMASCGDKIICTHINDNLGIKDYNGHVTWKDDLHLLPFDGVADWDDIVKRLIRYNFQGPLTFELKLIERARRYEKMMYQQMPLEAYIAEAYKRACKVSTLKRRYEEKLK